MNGDGHPLLDIKNLVKDFGGLRAVNNVSLRIREGRLED
jgi:ABC-type branched-subunit amino acid transport system ATPase component